IVTHVADDADDLVERRLSVRSQPHALANRIAIRPEASRHAFADDQCPRRVRKILSAEGASSTKWDLKRAEVIVRDRGGNDECLPSAWRCSLERHSGTLPYGRGNRRRGRDGRDAGEAA